MLIKLLFCFFWWIFLSHVCHYFSSYALWKNVNSTGLGTFNALLPFFSCILHLWVVMNVRSGKLLSSPRRVPSSAPLSSGTVMCVNGVNGWKKTLHTRQLWWWCIRPAGYNVKIFRCRSILGFFFFFQNLRTKCQFCCKSLGNSVFILKCLYLKAHLVWQRSTYRLQSALLPVTPYLFLI